MTKKWQRLGGIYLTAAFVVLGGFLLESRHQTEEYRRLLTLGYQHSFAEMTDQLEGLNSALQKGQYAASPALLSALCAEAYSRAAAAQVALGELPYSNVELEQTAAFLAKAGDYAYALNRKVLSEQTVPEPERQALTGLASVAGELSGRLSALQTQLYHQPITLETVWQAEERLADGEQGSVYAGSTFEEMESEFPELPTLLYDGPFSQHLTGQSPRYLEGKDQVDEATARERAGAFLDRDPQSLTLASLGQGVLPTYAFSLDEEGESLWIEVTRQGGVVVELLASRLYGPAQLLPESGLAIAKNFLLERGFSQMTESYTMRNGSLFTVSFAYEQEGVLCYPDLIKVTVALDTGEVVGFEAKGYVNQHRERDIPAPAVSREVAQGSVAPNLSVLAHRLALIPTAGQGEVFTHEFKCQAPDGSHILVYVDALTGREEKIFLLLEDENGTLVL